MEAMSIRLDQMESIKAAPNATQGLKCNYQGNSSFSNVLDKAMNATDGVQEEATSKAQEPEQSKSAEPEKENVTSKDSSENENVAEEKKEKVKSQKTDLSKVEKKLEEIDKSEVVVFEKQIPLEYRMHQAKAEKAPTLKDIKDVDDEEILLENVLTIEDEEILSCNFVAPDAIENVVKIEETDEIVPLTEQIPLGTSEQVAFAEDNLDLNPELTNSVNKLSSNKKDDKPLFSVIDERTTAENVEKDAGSKFVTSVQYDENGNAEMSLSLKDNNSSFTASVEKTSFVNAKESNFSSLLSSEIKNNAGEFVKTGMITLRDNNSGTINLVLHPEELGNVKIKLELTDKIITGKIIVASEEAYGAFKNNIENLRQAFVNSGFDNAGFELSWSGSEQNSNHAGQEKNQRNSHGFAYADTMPMAVGSEEYSVESYFGLTSVNVVV